MTAGTDRRSPPDRLNELAWVAAAGALALLFVGAMSMSLLLPLAALVGACLLLLSAVRPKAFALLALVVFMLAVPLQNALGTVGGFADEGMVALSAIAFSARRLMTEGRLVWLPGAGWFGGFLALGLLSATVASVPLGIALPGAFIALKGVVFAFALAQLTWDHEDLVVLVRAGITAIAVVGATALVNLAAPGVWAQLTTGSPPVTFVGPVPALNGIFQHPAAFSRFVGVLAVGCLMYGLVVRRSLANALLVALTGGLVALTFQVKSIVGLLATLVAFGSRFLRPVGAAVMICCAPLIALAVVPPLAGLVGGDLDRYVTQDSARSLIAQGGATVANEFFPLGAGFGRYGSATAAENYSPLYYELGFAGRYGLDPEGGMFLNDNQWPALYGETGWLGAFCFAAGLACMAVFLLRRSSQDEEPLLRWIRITGLGWMVLLLVESAASPVFVSSPSFPFVFAGAGIVASFRRSARDGRPILRTAGSGRRRSGRHREPVAEPV